MPELPEVELYRESLERLVVGQRLESLELASPFVLRSVDPPPEALVGRRLTGARRIGKRVVLAFEDELFLVLHPMIAGRLRWRAEGRKPWRANLLALLAFERGALSFGEAGRKKRARMHVVRGEQELAEHDPGGIEPLSASREDFARVLRKERHTLKRSLTDPRLFSGIGNAWSDEILHRARLSPFALSTALSEEDLSRLVEATRAVLAEGLALRRAEVGAGFPERVSAFHEAMAVHGRHGEPCPVCSAPVQRIVRAENEANYCARCQTEGRLLADRALSRLLHDDWPRTLEELEERRAARRDEPPDPSAARPR